MSASTALQVDLIQRAPDPVPDLPRLAEALEATAAHVRADLPARAAVSVVLVSDDEIADLSGKFRDYAHATDVLSFVVGEEDPETGNHDLGEIVVSVDTARREARRRGLAAEQELLLYALHGLLHCAGHEDKTDDGFAAMHAEEDRILSAIGVGPIFGREPIRAINQRGHVS